MQKIVALDPGKTTGIAILSFDAGSRIVESAHCTQAVESSALPRVLKDADTVIVERPFRSIAVDPVVFEVFGAAKAFAFYYNAAVVIQEPAITRYIKAKYGLKLAKHGSTSIHAQEAFYHLLNYIEQLVPGYVVQQIIDEGGFIADVDTH